MANPLYDSVTEKMKQLCIASSKVWDLTNDAKPALASHQEAQTEVQHASAVQPTAIPAVVHSALAPATFTSSYKHSSKSVVDLDDDDNNDTGNDLDCEEIKTTNAKSSSDFAEGNHMFTFLCTQLLTVDTAPGPLKCHRLTSPSMSPEPELENQAISVKDQTCDVDEFFKQPETMSGKKYRNCKFCR